MGKNDGSQDEALVVVSGAAEVVEDGGVFWSSVPEGLALMGRSGWSVGFVISDVAVGNGVMA